MRDQIEGDVFERIVADGRRILQDEPDSRMIARRGRDGEVTWERRGFYHGPVIVFDAWVNGERYISALDVVREAGGARRAIVRRLDGIRMGRDLHIRLHPAAEATRPPMLSGVELVRMD